MGGNGSTARNVSFGLDEKEKVTVIEGVKLSEDVLRRMRESQGSKSTETSAPPQSQKPAGPPTAEIKEEMHKKFERQQALVQEQLVKLAQREREAAAITNPSELTPALIVEKQKVHEEQDKAKLLPADLDAWAKQLDRKEQELATISSFYKEQLDILEKKSLDNYKQTVEEYSQASAKTEACIRARPTTPVCGELQVKVLQCYKENPQQTLHCSSLARQYMTCVQLAKKSPLTNHG